MSDARLRRIHTCYECMTERRPMYRKNYWPFDDHESERRFRELIVNLSQSNNGGVAFFGAGASVPASLPTWTAFHKEFLAHFGAQPSSDGAQSSQAMLTDIDYHTDRDPVKALNFVKETFAVRVSQIPPVVRLAIATRSLRYFYTTNLDEVLFEAAAGEKISAYPHYDPKEARFVYLHGRASTACSVHKTLVLGSQGYAMAYNEALGGFARDKLRSSFWPGPVIFIGTSMADQSVAWSLEEITRAARYRSVNPVYGEGMEVVSTLNWYILLKAPVRNALARDEDKRSRERYLRGLGLRVVWYQDGGNSDPHRGLPEVIQRIQRETRGLTVAETDPGFLENLLEAEELASLTSPTKTDVRRAKSILGGHHKIAAAFIDRVAGLQWFRGLRDAGALKPKPRFVSANGELQAPYWGPVCFLERVAAEAPSEVKDFLLSIETNNWVAIRQAFEILQALDEPSATALGAKFARWTVRAMAVDPHLLFNISRAAKRLNSDDKYVAALALVQSTLQELPEASPTLSDVGTYGLSEIAAPILARSESGLATLADTLRAALLRRCRTPDEDDVRHSRRAIEAHEMDRIDRSVVGLLIDVTRDTLLHTDNFEWRSSAVARLLQSPWPTERRIGIAHCFLMRSDLPTHESVIITRENLANPHLFHELARLISDGATELCEQSVEVLKCFVAARHAGATDDDNYQYWLWARVLPENWLPEQPPKDEDEDILDSDSRLFRDFYSSGVFSTSAPLDSTSFADHAARLTSDQLLALVRDPEAAGVRVTWRHDTEAMWSLLAEYAKRNGELAPLLEISLDDLSKWGSWRAVDAMPEVAGDDPERWKRVFDWSRRVASEAAEDQLWSLGRLIESSAKSVPLELSEYLEDLALRIIEKAKRTSAMESEITEDSLIGGYLNRPAGKSVQALFELLRRQMAESEATGDGQVEVPRWFIRTVLDLMAREPMALGIDAWIGLGRFYALLSSRFPDTVAFVAPHLKSESLELATTVTSFWAGYLWAPSVSSEALERLREAYGQSAPILQQDGALETDLRDRFFQHFVVGALREVPGFEDLVLMTLGAEFTPETRGSIATALGYAVKEAARESGTAFQVRAAAWFSRYWADHVNRFGGQDGTQLGKYLDWLRYLNLSPSKIAELIQESLAQVDRCFQVEAVFDYLERYVGDDPHTVLCLVGRCVEWYQLHGDFWVDRDRVRALLDQIALLTADDSTFRAVLEGFAELGAVSTEDVRRYLSGASS